MKLRQIAAPLMLGLLVVLLPVITLRATAADDWTVVFEDDFSGTGLPSAAGWDVIEGTGYPGGPQNGFGTDEIETMTRSTENIRRQDGFLRITPLRDAEGRWTSGRTETRLDYKPADGAVMRMECKLAHARRARRGRQGLLARLLGVRSNPAHPALGLAGFR